MRNFATWTCALTLFLFCVAIVRAQEIAGSIRGMVVDASGGVVSGAKLTAARRFEPRNGRTMPSTTLLLSVEITEALPGRLAQLALKLLF